MAMVQMSSQYDSHNFRVAVGYNSAHNVIFNVVAHLTSTFTSYTLYQGIIYILYIQIIFFSKYGFFIHLLHRYCYYCHNLYHGNHNNLDLLTNFIISYNYHKYGLYNYDHILIKLLNIHH